MFPMLDDACSHSSARARNASSSSALFEGFTAVSIGMTSSRERSLRKVQRYFVEGK